MLSNLLGKFGSKAPEFPKEFQWLNTQRKLSLSALKGHIVILDFWTYCCINCIHLVPVLEKLEEKYKNDPVVLIGVHTAKFDNEKEKANIHEAINRYEISHPVVIDQKMYLWYAYGANAWPTVVIIDPEGKIVYKKPGENDFKTMDHIVSGMLDSSYKDKTLAKRKIHIKNTLKKKQTRLLYPGKIAFSKDGITLAISDSNHNRILLVDKLNGKILHKIGGLESGFVDGSFTSARFFRPQGVAWDGNRIIYVSDTENHSLRKVDLDGGKVSTLSGDGSQARFTIPKHGIKGRGAQLNSPWDLLIIKNEIFIAMAGFHQIWKYNLDSEIISQYAGNGREGIEDGNLKAAEFAQPSGLSFIDQDLYVADSEASGVRDISIKNEYVSTLIGYGLFSFGNKDGKLSEAQLQHPLGVCAEGDRIYVADTYNHAIRIINTKENSVETLISTKVKSACRFDNPECDTLGLYEPSDVKISDGVLYIADTNNHLIRKYNEKTKILDTLELKD